VRFFVVQLLVPTGGMIFESRPPRHKEDAPAMDAFFCL
jgi:hypothetical protein